MIGENALRLYSENLDEIHHPILLDTGFITDHIDIFVGISSGIRIASLHENCDSYEAFFSINLQHDCKDFQGGLSGQSLIPEIDVLKVF